MSLYDEVVEYVNSTFQNKNTKHFERTVYWFEQLKDTPLTEMEKIAAYSHDIERGFRKSEMLLVKVIQILISFFIIKMKEPR